MSDCLHLGMTLMQGIGSIGQSKRTSGSSATIPGARFDNNACSCLENSESAPSAGCTDNMTSLDTYAILATVAQCSSQQVFVKRTTDGGASPAGEGFACLLRRQWTQKP